MARISLPMSLFAAACLAGASAGCATHRGPDGEKALWSTIDNSPSTQKDLKDPTKLHLAYARWQDQLGQLGDARHAYQLALEDNPQSVEATLGIARLDQLAGREQQAENGIQKALKMKPNEPFVLHSVGQFYASKKEWQKAGELLSRATMAEPENVVYRNDFAVALARAGKADQAMSHFVKSVGEAEAHYNVAYILYQQGQVDLAEKHLVASINKKRDLKQAQSLLAEVRAMRKDRSALAGTTSASNGVSPASHSIPAGTAKAYFQPVQQGGRLAINGQQRTAKGSQPRFTSPSPSSSATTNGASARQPRQQPAAEYHQVEQWNNQTGVW